jgi:hypothetical protein
MLHIEPLGTNVILPAFVVGYELGVDAASEDAILDAHPCDAGSLVVLEQQAGGYCMSYPRVAGVVLRLDANRDHAHGPLAVAIRGFKAMAEDPHVSLLDAEYPALRQLVYTLGDPYAADDLHRLEAFLRRFLHVPNLRDGIEAFVRFESCDVMQYVSDWRVMSYQLRPDHGPSLYANMPPNRYAVEEGNISDLLLADDERFDDAMLQRLNSFGKQLRRTDPPSLFFLWENSD